MKIKIIKYSAGLIMGAAISVFASTAYAVPMLVNGGFETGDFTGWTEVSNSGGSGCATDWYVSNNDAQCQQGSNVRLNSATEGNYAAYNSFDGSAGTSYTIEQDIGLGSVSAASLNFSYTLGWDFGLGDLPTMDRIFSLSFLDAGDSLIGDAYVLGIGPSDGITGFIDWTGMSLDVTSLLSGYGNQTVTLVADIYIPQSRTGPGSFGMDSIGLDVEPVPVPLPLVVYLLGVGLLMMSAVTIARKKISTL